MKSVLQVFSFNIISKAIMAVTGILLIRFMSQGEYALFTLAFSVMMVVTQAFTVSFNRIYIVGQRSLRLGGSSSPFLGFQLFAILGLAVMAYPFMGRSGGVYWFTLAATIATCFSEFTKTFYQEKMQFVSFSAVEIARTLMITVGTLAGIFFLGNSLTAWQVLGIQAVAMSLIFLLAFGRQLDLKGLFKINEVLELGRGIIKGQFGFLFGYYFLFSFFGQIDVFMLRSLSDDATLATYGSALRYYTLIIMALSSANAVLLPMTQKAKDVPELKTIFKKFTKLVAIFAPVVLIGAWASQWIIPAIDAGKYPQAITVFRILAISAIFSFALSPHVSLVMRYEKFKFLFCNVGMAILISIVLNILLVPTWGATGTAISTLLTFAFVNGSVYLKARRLLSSNIIPPGEPDENICLPAGEPSREMGGLQGKFIYGTLRPYIIKLRAKVREIVRRLKLPVKVMPLEKFYAKCWSGAIPDHTYFSNSKGFFYGPNDSSVYAERLKSHFPISCKEILDRATLATEHKFDLLGSGLTSLGQRIDWHTDFKSGKVWPRKHFTKTAIVDPGDNSDVKIPWELSRLQFLTDLGRAAWLTGDPAYKYEFKAILADWEAFNPVDIGVNWTCSMEAAIRAINILWGLHFFSFDDGEKEFVKRAIRLLYYHGLHIEKNLEIVSDGANSNHLISDYLGLLYLSLFLPELKCAELWKNIGKEGLEKEIQLQVFADGADYECSTSYHRLVLEIFLSAYILGKKNNISFSAAYESRLEAMLKYSGSITAPSGLAPLAGDNDDGFIVKLSTDNPCDHRPLVDIGNLALGKNSSSDIPITEERLWYIGPEALDAVNDKEKTGSHLFEDSGYAIVKGDDFHLLFNAAGVPERNFGGHKHNDLLSITLEMDGVPYLIDPGTFCYSADFTMRNVSRSVGCHNTVAIDDAEQNRFLAGKLFFLMRDASPKINLWTNTEDSVVVSASHDGYKRLDGGIVHKRTLNVSKAAREIIITDEFDGTVDGVPHKYDLQFITPILDVKKIDNTSVEIRRSNSSGIIIQASDKRLKDLIISRIEYFPRYGVKAPAIMIKFSYKSAGPFEINSKIKALSSITTGIEGHSVLEAAV